MKPITFAVNKTIEVTNLITMEKLTFVNPLTLTENIVNAIIFNAKQTGQLCFEHKRNEVKEKYNIVESTSAITGGKFAFCEEKNLHAKYIN